MSNKTTVQLIIQGEPAHVEEIAALARQYFDVVEEGKTQTIPLRAGHVRRVLRILPPPAGEDTLQGERKAA
jgi:hypothetical protein